MARRSKATDALIAFLKEVIDQRRWTQAQAAEEAGIAQSVLSDYLGGKKRPSVDILARIARGWGEDLDHMLELDGIPRSNATIAERATAGLTDDQLEWMASLDPDVRRRIVEAARSLRGHDTPS